MNDAYNSCHKCPKCGARLGVYYTRPQKDGSIKRVRICRACGYRRPSIER